MTKDKNETDITNYFKPIEKLLEALSLDVNPIPIKVLPHIWVMVTTK